LEFHSSHIPPLLRKVLDGSASLSETNVLVRHAHHFALMRLKQLIASGRLHLQSFPLTIESTAIDCIAELFERDSDGVFIELEHFFSVEHDLDLLTDDDVTALFRSLVFTKLHDGIFTLYRENDPVLSKILRNMKIALRQSTTLRVEQYLGMAMVVYASDEDRMHLPAHSIETVEQCFAKSLRGVKHITQYLAAFEHLISTSLDSRNMFSLIDLCVCIKRHIMNHQIPLNDALSMEGLLFDQDAVTLVESALKHIRKDLYQRYVAKKKLNEEEFTGYMNAIDHMIRDTFLHSDGSEKNYGEYLQHHLPEISYTEYREYHRKQFEYMVKLSKKAVRERLRELL